MGNLATLQQKQSFSLTPQSLDEALRFADMLSKSNMVPKDYQGNPANCIIAMQWGMEIGLQPLQAMQNIAVINGRPSIWGDAMLAIVRGSGVLEYIKEDPTDTGCTCIVKRKSEDEVSRTFTTEDAKRAGLLGKQGPWQQNPKRMMQMRARAFALRDVFPDVLRGVNIAEIVQDEPVEKDITAEGETVAEAKPEASRAERTKAALASRKKEQVATPAPDFTDFSEVVAAIQRAETPEEMAAAAKLCDKLEPDDKAEARRIYKDRLEHLKEQATASQAETVMSYAEVADKIQKAANEDQLAEAADLIQYVGGITQRDELGGIYKRKADEFKAQ